MLFQLFIIIIIIIIIYEFLVRLLQSEHIVLSVTTELKSTRMLNN